MTTATTILQRSLQGIGNVGTGETPSADDMDTSFQALNDMLDSWSIDKLYVFETLEENFALTSGTASYTIGSGGTFNTTRPVKINKAYVRLSDIDYDLEIINGEAFANIPQKSSIVTIPEFLWYNPTSPLGTIKLFPVPQASLTLYIQTSKQLTQFATQATNVTLAPGYAEAIRYSLMPRLAAEGLGEVTPDQIALAMASTERIRTNNSKVPVLKNEFYTGSRFNIFRGF